MTKVFILTIILFSNMAFSQSDGSFLDPAYKDLIHPKVIKNYNKNNSKSNTLHIINNSTSIKSQISRGTCSIFSAVAILETMLILKKDLPKTLNLSEEYLEYLAVRNKTSDGSNSYSNFSALRKHGVPTEKTYPYIGDNWVSSPWIPQIESRCGHLDGDLKVSCLIIHRDPALLELSDTELLNSDSNHFDPEFVKARTEATKLRDEYIQLENSWFGVYNTSEVKQKLKSGVPLTLGIRFYYGAWNHRNADKYDIGRDTLNWNQGIVGYPEKGSVDRKISQENPAGHSVLIVGYDDNKTVTTSVKMEDGTMKTFSYKGVYYFKNSWGTKGFGKDFDYEGKSFSGYGMITQKHAHEHGGFYHLPLK